jgi:hypothetical protein
MACYREIQTRAVLYGVSLSLILVSKQINGSGTTAFERYTFLPGFYVFLVRRSKKMLFGSDRFRVCDMALLAINS